MNICINLVKKKLAEVQGLLPILFTSNIAMENAFPDLEACVHAQKQKDINKLISDGNYKPVTSHLLELL